jgi:PIN domain nuclease of toxin-antitoxin system
VGISCISLFELAWLAENQRIVLKTSLEAFLIEVETRFLILPITAAVTHIAVEFPSPYPLDPMDRIIGATALDRGVPLVTKDKMIRKAKEDATDERSQKSLIICQEMNDGTGRPCRRRITGTYKASE